MKLCPGGDNVKAERPRTCRRAQTRIPHRQTDRQTAPKIEKEGFFFSFFPVFEEKNGPRASPYAGADGGEVCVAVLAGAAGGLGRGGGGVGVGRGILPLCSGSDEGAKVVASLDDATVVREEVVGEFPVPLGADRRRLEGGHVVHQVGEGAQVVFVGVFGAFVVRTLSSYASRWKGRAGAQRQGAEVGVEVPRRGVPDEVVGSVDLRRAEAGLGDPSADGATDDVGVRVRRPRVDGERRKPVLVLPEVGVAVTPGRRLPARGRPQHLPRHPARAEAVGRFLAEQRRRQTRLPETRHYFTPDRKAPSLGHHRS
mmetsp:Transcript_27346/g.88333  ORF Transcript_27346/g.88333 Transcript_27346/m.88333 type:complete len:312 (-) Transcript_27346:110-1045(-)